MKNLSETPGTPVLYSMQQIAEMTGLHLNTVRLHCRTGKIKAKKIGKQWYVGKDGLEDLLPK